MHRDRNHGRDDQRPSSEQRNEATNAERDSAIDFAVLAVVLDRYPTQLTISEVKREIVEDLDSFAQADAVERAVRDLVGAGLLHRHGQFALPTRAAVHFERIGRG